MVHIVSPSLLKQVHVGCPSYIGTELGRNTIRHDTVLKRPMYNVATIKMQVFKTYTTHARCLTGRQVSYWEPDVLLGARCLSGSQVSYWETGVLLGARCLTGSQVS